ncbi:MAG: hypothetical protein IPO58_17410 [Betaproteobacteria bacterium]|nr:hypothetical protein [Betaproteobacteria bacterium]
MNDMAAKRVAPSTPSPAGPVAAGAAVPVTAPPAAVPGPAATPSAPTLTLAPPPAPSAPTLTLAPPPARSAPSVAVAPPPAPTPALRAAPAVSAEAGAAPRLEKPSLQSAPVESRLLPGQAIPEVRDSAPTYPNEVQSSIPLPYTYATPRAAARDAAAAGGAGSSAGPAAGSVAGSAAGRFAQPQQLAAAPPLRDPVEWIKAIQKLRAEGKSGQVLKELTEFRRQHPRYPLPDELKNLK